jgi:hypothetical protein
MAARLPEMRGADVRAQRDRLTSPQASLLKDLTLRAGLTGRVTLKKWQRELVLPLWRRELVEIWFRHTPDHEPFRRGPFYALTTSGYAIGAAIWSQSRQSNRRQGRHNRGATHHHDEHSRVRPDEGAGLPGRHFDRPDSRRDRDLDHR